MQCQGVGTWGEQALLADGGKGDTRIVDRILVEHAKIPAASQALKRANGSCGRVRDGGGYFFARAYTHILCMRHGGGQYLVFGGF